MKKQMHLFFCGLFALMLTLTCYPSFGSDFSPLNDTSPTEQVSSDVMFHFVAISPDVFHVLKTHKEYIVLNSRSAFNQFEMVNNPIYGKRLLFRSHSNC